MSKVLAPALSGYDSSVAQNQQGEEQMLHIAIDGTALYGVFGGVEYSLWNLLKALRDLETPHRFTVFIPQDGPGDAVFSDFGPAWQWRRLPFRGASKARRIFWQQWQFPKELKDFDLLHAPTYVSPLRSPIPVVLGVYDIIALTHPEFATRTNRLHYGFVLPRALRRATHIIVPSQAVKNEVFQLANHVPVSVVPLGVEDDFYDEISAEDIKNYQKKHDLPAEHFFFAGNFEPKKNIAALLNSHALLRQRASHVPPLIIAGGARRWEGHEIESDGKNVRLLGHVPRHEMPFLYGGCTAFVFPTLAEGFCLPVLEALALGAPVVTTKAVPLPNIETVVRLCDPHDVESLADEMQFLWKNRDEAREMRLAARQYAQEFTWKRTARQTLAIYEKVGLKNRKITSQN